MKEKVYQVIYEDEYNNLYDLGFYNSLDDEKLLNEINQYIDNENCKVKAGDLGEYASTFSVCFDREIYDAESDTFYGMIRGFIFDKELLKKEIGEL